MAQYEIYKRTTAGKRGTLIEEYNTFEAVLRFNEIGKWSLTSRGSSLCPFSENEGIIVYRNGVVLLSGYITNITEEADESCPESALITWNVEGLEDTGMLQRRIIYPDPVNLSFTTADFHTITDHAGNAILSYIDKHAGSGAHADRKVPNLVIDALDNLGDSATYKGRFEVLWDFIIAIANTADLGIRIVWDGSTGNIEAQVYEPSDKSATVIFSRDFGNLKGWKRKRTAPSGNVIIAGGEGEGVDRLMSVVSDSASITKWGRTEQFLDSGVSTEQDDEDPRTPAQINEDEATAKLTDSAATDGYELDIIDVDRMQYKTDWDLGDKVSIRVGNTSFTSNIKEVKITYSGTIEKITPSVGTIDKGNLATIFTALQETEARVTALEAKEGSGGSGVISFDSIYPVGSIYMSVNSTNPSTLFGGTWTAWGAGRVPVGFDSSQSEFDTVEETGGSKTHSHKYGLQYGGFHCDTVLENDENSGALIYDSSGNITVTGGGTNIGAITTKINNNTASGTKSVGTSHYRMIGQSEYISSLQPYITCYMWKRTA
jgi:hypothetical protein